jgi:hypothetical protein
MSAGTTLGRCPKCGQRVALFADGTCRDHEPVDGWGWCPGARFVPEPEEADHG